MSDVNPYQPPATASEPPVPVDLLRLPAAGCAFTGMVTIVLCMLFAALVIGFYVADPFLPAEQRNRLRDREIWEHLSVAAVYCGLGGLSVFVSRALRRRRNRWIVVAAAVLGLVLCLPGPLAALILLRLWRRDIWTTFDRKAPLAPE